MQARYNFEMQLNSISPQLKMATIFRSKNLAKKEFVIFWTPRIQGVRDTMPQFVRLLTSLSLRCLSLFLAISPPTSLKGDGGLAREGRRKRVNQAECVPEPGARGLKGERRGR